MTAEELAVIAPIPNAVVDDANVAPQEQVRPLLAEAIGKKVDQAVLFGSDKPASWPTAIIPAAIAADNTVTAATGTDFGVGEANLAEKVSVDGLAVNGSPPARALPGGCALCAIRTASPSTAHP